MVLVLAGLTLAFLFVFVHAFATSERAVLGAFRADLGMNAGIRLAMKFCAGERALSDLPAVAIIPDPLFMARVIRRPGGSGTLLVSQGLLAHYNDEEIVAVMQEGLRLLSRRDTTFRSACSGWLTRVQRLKKEPWTPLKAIFAWTALPLENFLRRQDSALRISTRSNTTHGAAANKTIFS